MLGEVEDIEGESCKLSEEAEVAGMRTDAWGVAGDPIWETYTWPFALSCTCWRMAMPAWV